MKLGITGAAGQMGTALVRHAVARTDSANVVAITRNPAKITGVEARAGDFNDPATLGAAFKGVNRLVIIPTGDLAPGVRTKQHTDAIKAAVDAGVGHIIYISTVSPRPDANNALLDSHFRTEQALIASSVDWTILRMAIYADTLLMGAKQAVASGTYSAILGAPAAYCTRDDIAAAAAGLLTSSDNGGHAGITYHATGPVSIGQREVADAIGKASGKSIAFAESTIEDQKKGLEAAGLPPFIISAVMGFAAALRAGAFDLVTGDVGRLAGKPATSPVDFLTAALKA